MGAQDVRPFGYPRTDVKKDYEYSIYCGGLGAGSFVTQTNRNSYNFVVRNDQFSVRNRRLIIRNNSFTIFKQATPAGGGFFSPVAGTEAPLKAWAFPQMLLDDTLAKYMEGGIDCPAVPPYDVVFEGRKPGAAVVEGDLPQPGDPDYNVLTYIYLFWGDPSYWWYGLPGSATALVDSLQIKKQDTDTRQ